MLNIQLYIQGNEIELDKTVNFPLTKQYEDLNDPTTIINDWSRTIEIPGSVKNNNTFGSIFRPDRLITNASGVGINFDPTQKLDMKLIYNGDLLLLGYAKVNSVVNKNGNIKYNITLNGLLGKLFQEMQLMSFDPTTELKYYIDTHLFVNERMDKELIYNAWNSDGQQHIDLYDAVMNGDINDFIGFTPNNAMMKGFTYDAFLSDRSTTTTFEDELSKSEQFKFNNIEPKVVIPNGLSPRGYGEFRSYLQIPYVYFNKLFQIVQEKAEELTGYNWELDDAWFNERNPYWNNLTYVLKPIGSLNQYNLPNSYSVRMADKAPTTTGDWNQFKYIYIITGNNPHWETDPFAVGQAKLQGTVISETYVSYNPETGYYEFEEGKDIFTSVILSFDAEFYVAADRGEVAGGIHRKYAYTVDINAVNKQGQVIRTWKVGIVNKEHNEVPTGQFDQVFEYLTADTPNSTHYDLTARLSVAEDFRLEIKGYWTYIEGRPNIPTVIIQNSTYEQSAGESFYFRLNTGTMDANINVGYERSFAGLTFPKMWEMEYKPFNEILRYCKTFGILITVDEITHKLKFTQRNNYFKNYSITDWTNKVDFSKDFTVIPVNTDSRFMKLQYDENDSGLNKEYHDKYGYRYGEIRVETGYNFNSETKDIMPASKSAIVGTPNVITWKNLNERGRVIYTAPNEDFLDCYRFDGEYTSQFGTYLFRIPGKAAFDTEEALNLTKPRITDDSNYMTYMNVFMFDGRQSEGIVSDYYSKLSSYLETTDANKSMFKFPVFCIYNKPLEQYSLSTEYSVNSISIYDIIWKNWFNERHNIQNKQITCYVDMSPTDYLSFEFNKFIKIDDILYFVNKIYDYDVTTNNLTKVDLLQISNISAYTTMPFVVEHVGESTNPNITFNRGELVNIQVEIPNIVKQDGVVVGFKVDDNTTSTTSTLSNGSMLSLVNNKVVLTYNLLETGAPVDTTLGSKIYLYPVTDSTNAPGRGPVEINYDELDTIG